jgi:hypothetical protein
MTKEDLEKMGVVYVGSKLHPNLFFIPQVGEVNLYQPYSWEDVFQEIYRSGYANGTEYGKAMKIGEIKRVLEIV